MKKTTLLIFFLPWLSVFSGCGSNEGGIDWKADVHAQEETGWKYKETLGSPGTVALELHMESDTANVLTGGWAEKGERHSKEYKQDSQLYYLFTFTKTNGDSFVVVLSKDKPK